jgi:hypothetical protein
MFTEYEQKLLAEGYKSIPGYEHRYMINQKGNIYDRDPEWCCHRIPTQSGKSMTISLNRFGRDRSYTIRTLIKITFPLMEPYVDNFNI